MRKHLLAVGWIPFLLLADAFSNNPFLKVFFGVLAGCWIFILTLITLKQLEELIRQRKK